MRGKFPSSLNCWLKDYPRAIKITCGPAISLLEGPWVAGQEVYLFATPMSKQWDPSIPQYSIENLGSLQAIYTDTAMDDYYTLKLTMEGYGSFLYDENVANYWLAKEILFKIKSHYNGKTFSFHHLDDIYTMIPNTVEIYGIDVPEQDPIYVDPDPDDGDNDTGQQPPPAYALPTAISHAQFARPLIQYYASLSIPAFTYIVNGTITVTKEIYLEEEYLIGGTRITNPYQWFLALYENGYCYRNASSMYNDYNVYICENGDLYCFFLRNSGPDISFDDAPIYTVEYIFRWTVIRQNGVSVLSNLKNVPLMDR